MSHKELMRSGDLYRHYKGVLYRVLDVATESTNARAGELVVIYIGDAAHGVHVRTLAEFSELVEWPDGTTRPRFEKINEILGPSVNA